MATPDVLRGLEQLHCSAGVPDFRAFADAAKSRVFHWEALGGGGLRVAARARALRQLRWESDLPDWRVALWQPWLDSNFLFSLERADEHVRFAAPGLIRESTTVARQQWQRVCYNHLVPDFTEAFLRHFRRRLERWAIALLPGRRVDRAVEVLQEVWRTTTPRILAALLRTMCNGWVTARRMQESRPCILLCGRGHDSIEHYAHCHVSRTVTMRKLRLPDIAPPDRLQHLLGLGAATARDRTVRAIALYALYSTHCALRHGHRSPVRMADLLLQLSREGVRGHAGATRMLTAALAGFP